MADQRQIDQSEMRVAVLLSGTGRTLANLLSVFASGDPQARILKVVSSRQNVRGNEIARDAGIPLAIIPRRNHSSIESFSHAVFAEIDPLEIDLILMAGFLCKLDVPPRFTGKILNIHPSLLPFFGGKGMYGDRVHAAVLESGMRVSGCTVHFVDNEYDAGPILLQECVPVHPDDDVSTLAARVFELECRLYPEAIRMFAEGRRHGAVE
jgi:formyltetrahydrofolate-dependent phosphoribosylglycinamide formyltransferase